MSQHRVTVHVQFGGSKVLVGRTGAGLMSVARSAGATGRLRVPIVAGGGISDSAAGSGAAQAQSTVTMIGAPNQVGTTKSLTATPTGQRVHVTEVTGWEFPPGTGPFFSQVLPDGTVCMPHLPLSNNQVNATMTSFGVTFWAPHLGKHYQVLIPTTTGHENVLAVTAFGVQQAVGGADGSDCAVVTISGTPVLFVLSALPYRGWDVNVYGEWPVLAAFTLNAASGRWEYDSARSIWASQLQASDPLYGATAWPNTTNAFNQTVVTTRLSVELAALPRSQHLVIAIYGPRSGRNTGSVSVVNPATKAQVAFYEFPDFTSVSGATFRAFPRDINTDPTSATNDERIALNFDTFMQPNEKLNVIVNATGGQWRVAWAENFTSSLALGAGADTLRTALEALPGIGAGNVKVTLSRPFLVNTYSVYEVEFVGSLARTNLSATTATLDTSALTGNNASTINRWQTGSTSHTAHAPFALIELAYNASVGTVTPVCAPLIPQDAIVNPTTPEATDASFGMAWYDAQGTLWANVTGKNPNPQASTLFLLRGVHGYRKFPSGNRRYVADWPPSTGWESRWGEAVAVPDAMTDPQHRGNGMTTAICEDPKSGGIVTPNTNGILKLTQPTLGLQPRTGNLLASDVPADWVASGGHSVSWNAGENALAITAASTAELVAQSGTGTGAAAIPASWEGEVLHYEIDAKAATVGRATQPVVRFFNQSGTEVGALTGYGPATRTTTTTGYTTIVGSAKIPAGTRFVSLGVAINGHATNEVHYLKRATVTLAPWYPLADVNSGASLLFAGQPGAPALAKGFVDPHTRDAWFPYFQILSVSAATNTRFPGWLVRVATPDLFPQRRTSGT